MKTRIMLSLLLALFASVGHAESSDASRVSAQADAKTAAQAKRLAEAQKELKAKFEKADADHDGKLTEAEAKAGMPKVAEHFKVIDKAGTGFVTTEDIRVYVGDQIRLAKSLAK